MTSTHAMRHMRPRGLGALALLWLVWLTGPYLLAAWMGRRHGLVFAGFLHNPYDNFTYLAKMAQGWHGAWVYRLAFTTQPGPGAPIFLYYLALGHLARVLHAPLLAVYHAARLLNGMLLWAALAYAVRRWFPQRPWAQRLALGLALFGSGMGWLRLPFVPAEMPPDMGVPEAYPYLAGLTNPHFPLMLALLTVLVLWPWSGPVTRRRRALWLALAALLSVIYPFGVVVALAALGVGGLPGWWWQRMRRRLQPAEATINWPAAWHRALWVALGGLPYPLYALWAIRQDPTLVAWNAQNLTPSPAWWVMLLALSPALPVGLYWMWEHWGQGRLPAGYQAPAWAQAVNSVFLSQLPLALQRRFFAGAYPPAALGVVAGLEPLPQPARRRWTLAVVGLSLPSTLLVLAGYLILMAQGSPVLYLTPDEQAALTWIRTHTPAEAGFLSSPETGARIPALADRPVVVGHPMETPQAAQATAFVRQVLCEPGDWQAKARAARERGAAYLFIGPREAAFCRGTPDEPQGLPVVFARGAVRIYALPAP